MNRKYLYWTGGVVVALVVAIAIGMAVHRPSAGGETTAKADDSEGAATVTTAPIKTAQVSQTVTAYGNVTAQPGAVVVLSESVECRVKHLLVAGGQTVDAGAAVIDIEPSPDARLQLLDARNALTGMKKDAAVVHQRFDLKLATNGEVQTADEALQAAQTKFDDLTSRGAGEQHKTITADAPSVVAKVDVQEGQLVPAGAALVELVPRGQIEVRLGVEPDDAMLLRPGQPVRLFPSGSNDEAIDATIRTVTRRVNPDTRLVDVFAGPAQTDRLLLDGFVRGELTLKTTSGLVVPHEALLPDDQGFSIFTVVDDHAVKHAVKVVIQNDTEAVITGDGLAERDAVVVAGSLELDDKAAVKATAATTAPADAGGQQ